ncbi:MAG: hypothetical protein H7Y17_03290 [Chlorobia bacterium]|nr:hypothetical protein [Fimbriimonadaceae bacterium]
MPVLAEVQGVGVVVFDAGSTDGSVEYLTARSETSLIPMRVIGPQRDGESSFAHGVNAACAEAMKQWPSLEALFLYETDNAVQSSQPLAHAALLLDSDASIGAVGFTVRKHSGQPAGWGQRFPTVMSFLLGPHVAEKWGLTNPSSDRWREGAEFPWQTADVVYTSPLLIRRTTWEASSGLDAATFPFADCDVDWAWRVHLLGLKLAVIRTDQVIHDNSDALSNWSQTRVQHFHQARLALLKRYSGDWIGVLKPLLWLRHVMEWLALVLAAPMRQNARRSLQKRWRLMGSVMRDYR